jgi:hypothetical protein
MPAAIRRSDLFGVRLDLRRDQLVPLRGGEVPAVRVEREGDLLGIAADHALDEIAGLDVELTLVVDLKSADEREGVEAVAAVELIRRRPATRRQS